MQNEPNEPVRTERTRPRPDATSGTDATNRGHSAAERADNGTGNLPASGALPRHEQGDHARTDSADANLIAQVRTGNLTAFGALYHRHVAAARHLARQLTRSPAEIDDLVADSFERVLRSLLRGGGPTSAFRAYLLTALRNLAYDRTRRTRRLHLIDDLATLTALDVVDPVAVSVPFIDTASNDLDRALVAAAFLDLPPRWQHVLRLTEIHRHTPAEIAPTLGLTPNAVSALAFRARERLRQQYLQHHLTEAAATDCAPAHAKLGAWVRNTLSNRDRRTVEDHLQRCPRCRAAVADLTDVADSLARAA